jgi:peptidoglycan/LPS O-acetylase OafA/YrhL
VRKSGGAWILSIALVLLSGDAFRQVPDEFRDTEPGSLLFGVLKIVMGTAAAAAAVGVFRRASWSAWCIGIWGIATAALLVAQPVFEPMASDETQAIWLGAAVVAAAALGIGWLARRLAKQAAAARTSADSAHVQPPPPVLLHDAQRAAEPIIAREHDAT